MKVIVIKTNETTSGEFIGCGLTNITIIDENGVEKDIPVDNTTRFILEGHEETIIDNLMDLIALYEKAVHV